MRQIICRVKFKLFSKKNKHEIKLARKKAQRLVFFIKLINQSLTCFLWLLSILYIIQIQVKLILLKLLLCEQTTAMINPNTSTSSPDSQVYGFLCQKTNVFYAFQSYETYQQFLQWLQTQSSDVLDSSESRNTIQDSSESRNTIQDVCIVNQEDQLADYQRATREIMRIFNDPVFEKMQEQIQLQEVDF